MKVSKYLKTSQYAKMFNLHQRTVIANFHKQLIDGYQDPKTKTIYLINPEYKEQEKNSDKKLAILYARVSSTSNKKSLDGQIERMRLYAYAKGYTIIDEIQEIASGLNDERHKLNQIFERSDFNILLCEHPDRLTRFGYRYIEKLFKRSNVIVESINVAKNEDDELMNDFVSLVTSFCNRIYGRKRSKEIIKELISEEKN